MVAELVETKNFQKDLLQEVVLLHCSAVVRFLLSASEHRLAVVAVVLIRFYDSSGFFPFSVANASTLSINNSKFFSKYG